MPYIKTLRRKTLLIGSAAMLVLAGLSPLLNVSTASAAQVTNRKITIGTSKVSTSTTYSASFNVTQTTQIKGIVIEFCQDSPLIGQSCNHTNGVTATPTTGTVVVTNVGGTGSPLTMTVNAASSAGKLILTHATGFTPVTTAPVTFSFSATNPSTTGTFYGRILTYTSDTTAAAYTSTAPGTHLDDGGIALSTANQLTINARVQEQLTFCVGTTAVNDATTTPGTDCTAISGTTVDLGVVDSSAVYTSPVATGTGGNNVNGVAMVRTNANNGATVSYFAEQDASTGTDKGALKVASANCVSSSSNVDQCFNSAGTTQTAFTAGTEKFGMTIGGTNCGSTTSYTCAYASNTNNLKPSSNYIGAAAQAYGTTNGFAWDDSGTSQQIASSSTVVDDEALMLRFAGTASITTPTGSYGVTSTYVATSTF